MKNYKYVGNGMGVPGLPHFVTDEEAELIGMKEVLKQALANGSYVEVTADKQTKNLKKESEVNDG